VRNLAYNIAKKLLHATGDSRKIVPVLNWAPYFHSFIHSCPYSPFVGPSTLLQFRHRFYTDGRTPWMSDQPVSRLLPTHRQHKHGVNAHTDINALTGIRTHYHNVRASEDSSCCTYRGYCDRQLTTMVRSNMEVCVYSSTYSQSGNLVAMSGRLHSPNSPAPGKQTSVPIGSVAGWNQECSLKSQHHCMKIQ
jgi:hypothetical protein